MWKRLLVGVVSVLFFGAGCAAHWPNSRLDNGLVSFCWQADGHSDFSNNSCVSPNEFSWAEEDIPLTVHVAHSDMILSDVISRVNSDVGCRVLTLEVGSESRYTADVTVILDEPYSVGEDRGIASTTFRRDAMGRVHSYVTLYALGLNSTMRYRALLHEFGHVLGLEHDSWHGSIMYPRLNDSMMSVVGFTDRDSALLNGLYCHPNSTGN